YEFATSYGCRVFGIVDTVKQLQGDIAAPRLKLMHRANHGRVLNVASEDGLAKRGRDVAVPRKRVALRQFDLVHVAQANTVGPRIWELGCKAVQGGDEFLPKWWKVVKVVRSVFEVKIVRRNGNHLRSIRHFPMLPFQAGNLLT